MNRFEKFVVTVLWTVVILIGFGMYWALTARADDAPMSQGERATCQSPEYIRLQIMESVPIAVLSAVGKSDLPDFMKRFNALPPESDLEADLALTFTVPGHDWVQIIFFKDDCVEIMVRFPEQVFDDLMTGSPT